MAKTDGVARIIALAALGKNGGGSTGGTTNYLELANKPKINNVELTGNKTLEDLGINIPDLENYYTKDMVNEAFLTKTNTTSFTPTGDYNPATKKYVDDGLNDIKLGNITPVYCLKLSSTTNILEVNRTITSTVESELQEISKIITDAFSRKGFMLYVATTVTSSYVRNPAEFYVYTDLSTHPTKIYGDGQKIYRDINDKYATYLAAAIVITGTWVDDVFTATEIYIGGSSSLTHLTLDTNVLTKNNTTSYTPTANYHPATKKYVDDNVKTYTAGENITISEDNVISANVSSGTDANAVYTYYAPYSDDDWFTEGNVANILQTVKDKGYSNFELCTLNGSHYALRSGGNLQALTTTEEYYDLEYLPNDLKYYTWYTFSAKLDENGKIVIGELRKNDLTAEELVSNLTYSSLAGLPGYDQSVSHLILQANAGNLEWDSSLDGGIFGDSYTDPTYYTEKQVDKIVTDTVNEALGGKY